MVANRELCITTDESCYDSDEVDNYNIAPGYNTANDWITYQSGATHTPAFKSLRVDSFSEAPNRSVIIEESIDQVAAASIFGGVDSITGNFACNFRGWDFHLNGLLLGALGLQTPASVASNTAHNAGYKYELAMAPATLALKIVDNQATDTTGSNNVLGTTTIYRGVGITGFNLGLNAKETVKATVNWLAKRAEAFDIGYNTTSTINGDPAIFYNAVLKWTPTAGSAETMKCKGFTMDLSRTMDTDNIYIGSEFLQGLYYNGLTALGGQITLGPGDWQRIRTMMTGATTGGVNTLDEGKREFLGDAATGNVLANAIPSGKLEVIMHTADGSKEVAKITCNMAKLTEAARDVSGQNMFNKTVNWQAQINTTDKFEIEVYQP